MTGYKGAQTIDWEEGKVLKSALRVECHFGHFVLSLSTESCRGCILGREKIRHCDGQHFLSRGWTVLLGQPSQIGVFVLSVQLSSALAFAFSAPIFFFSAVKRFLYHMYHCNNGERNGLDLSRARRERRPRYPLTETVRLVTYRRDAQAKRLRTAWFKITCLRTRWQL